jgi:hypothetical protein
MPALTQDHLPIFAGLVPARGTFPISANTRLFKGALLGKNSSGQVIPGGPLAGGTVAIVGVSSAQYNNLTGGEFGGLANSVDVEAEYGVFGFNISSTAAVTAADVGTVVFCEDDNTISRTSQTSTLAAAGVLTEVRNGKAFVWIGPHVSPLTA